MNKVRYFKLKNSGGFVARMQIAWNDNNGKHGTYEPGGYHDICAAGERTLDLNDTDIPENASVFLKVCVVLGKDKEASELYEYDKTCSETASYEISGTTLISKLVLKDYK